MATEADAALWCRRPVQQIGGAFADTEQWRYGRDWAWGDLTSAEFNGEVLTVRVHAVTLAVERGQRRVAAELRADSSEADDAVRRIEGQLDAGAATELPLFTATPTPGAAPLAGVDGHLDAGWLDPADLPAGPQGEPGPPGPAGPQGEPLVADAPNDGEIIVGVDGGWGLGKVSDILGVSEIPGPRRSPLSGAGGTLADGWLSANIPRLSASNTFSASQILTLTHATANTTLTAMTYNMLSSTTPAAGFGQDHYYNLEADSGTNRTAALQRISWAAATDASRRGRVLFYVFDAAGARECLRLEASGTAPAVGFNGAAAVARQSLAALTVSVGTADGVVADVGAAFNQTTLNNNFRDLADKINQVRTLLVNVGLAV